MATKLHDLDEYFKPGLTLTVRGKEYTVPLPSAELGLWCRRVAAAAGELHAASTEQEIQAVIDHINSLPELPGGRGATLPERVLGDAYQQMVADGVPDPYIQFCAQTAYVWIIGGEEAAARYWTSGGRPEAWSPTLNRAQRRATARAGGTSTGAAAATRSRASTSGTTSRTRSHGSRRPSRSRGRTS